MEGDEYVNSTSTSSTPIRLASVGLSMEVGTVRTYVVVMTHKVKKKKDADRHNCSTQSVFPIPIVCFWLNHQH